ncbi:DMT family transporter [Celeribacter sp.]|uniref:DMT family transporter n=1 Tax=Celeribacter sp. TaxID=1890673 RepID=UPI003A952F47
MNSEQTHPLKAAAWMLGAVFGFSSMAVLARRLTLDLDTFEIMAYRSGFGLIAVLIVASVAGTAHQIRATAMPLHFGRNVAHFAGQNLWLFAAPLIPLSQLFALEFAYPIIVAIGASIFLGERLTQMRVITAALGFTGIMIVAQPFGAGGLSIGTLAAIACAFGFAGSALFTKRLTRRADGTVTNVLFWLSVMQLVFGIICAMLDGEMRFFTLAEAPLLAAFALAGLLAHFCLTTALSLAPASVVTPIDFLRLPLIALIALVLYGEPTTVETFIGAAIIFGANYANIVVESRRARTLSQSRRAG